MNYYENIYHKICDELGCSPDLGKPLKVIQWLKERLTQETDSCRFYQKMAIQLKWKYEGADKTVNSLLKEIQQLKDKVINRQAHINTRKQEASKHADQIHRRNMQIKDLQKQVREEQAHTDITQEIQQEFYNEMNITPLWNKYIKEVYDRDYWENRRKEKVAKYINV